MKEQLLETWRTHHRMNLLVIENISDKGMQLSAGTKAGRNIFQQWIHIHNVRLQWLEVTAPDLAKSLTKLDKDMPFFQAELLKHLEGSSQALLTLFDRAWDSEGKVKGFKKGVIPLLGYFISHESHHRGNILLTLKQGGEKLADAVKWGIWEWGK